MTFHRPCRRRTVPSPSLHPHPHPAPGLSGEGRVESQCPRAGGLSHPFPSGLRLRLSAGGRGGARHSPGGAWLRGLHLVFLNCLLVVFKLSQSSTLWGPYPVPRTPILDYPERPESGEFVEETKGRGARCVRWKAP